MVNRIPDRWEAYSRIGNVIKGTRFICFKVPLKQLLCANLPVEEAFTPSDLISQLHERGQDLGIVFDLTNTKRYYNCDEFTSRGMQYTKIYTEGHVVPNSSIRNKFFNAVDQYLKENVNNDRLVGVHCTHGVNRTGYLVCKYMVMRMNFSPTEAINAFNESRGHSIERTNYLDDLHNRKSGGDAAEVTKSSDAGNWRHAPPGQAAPNGNWRHAPPGQAAPNGNWRHAPPGQAAPNGNWRHAPPGQAAPNGHPTWIHGPTDQAAPNQHPNWEHGPGEWAAPNRHPSWEQGPIEPATPHRQPTLRHGPSEPVAYGRAPLGPSQDVWYGGDWQHEQPYGAPSHLRYDDDQMADRRPAQRSGWANRHAEQRTQRQTGNSSKDGRFIRDGPYPLLPPHNRRFKNHHHQ